MAEIQPPSPAGDSPPEQAPTPVPESASTREPEDRLTRLSHAAALYELTKPGIAGYVMITTGVAYYVAARGAVDWMILLHTLFGTVLATGGALALNQFIEREADALMHRTRGRPIPSGRLPAWQALAFGLFLLVAGLGHTWFWVGARPAALTLLSAVVYNLVYTPLKPRSYLATLAGAIPGAMPALIGWSAAVDRLDTGAAVLFGIAFLWQLPHVLGLAWMLREDYERAGFLLMPPTDPEGRTVGPKMLGYSIVLIPMSVAPTALGYTGIIYATGAAILGSALVLASLACIRDMNTKTARRVFLGSLAYHPLISILMILDTVRI
jgi:protoheme IX farnesyltransferase